MTRPPGRIARWRIRQQVARQLADAMRSGNTLISVPGWLAAETKAWVYLRGVERASQRWADRVAEVPLSTWQATMHERIDRLGGSDQAGSGRDEHTDGP